MIGPIGLPAYEVVYVPVIPNEGVMNAQHDYVITMSKDELPPAKAFWSLTLYDQQNGFFIPNDRKKYSVGHNAGMTLNADGGIEIHIAAEQPDGVPADNWLPIVRRDENLDVILRVYIPDESAISDWQPPFAKQKTSNHDS